MSEENVEMFWRSIEAFNARDVDAMTDLITDDFEFAPYLAAVIETTSYRGLEGLRKYRSDADAAWEEIEVRVDSLRDLGDRLIAFGELRGRGRGSGLEIQAPLTWLVDFREGKLSALRGYQTASEALEAAGLVV
jgi:ketosteroid isomerase-like protein